MIEPHDDLLAALGDLPICDTDKATSERVRRAALATFLGEHDLATHSWWRAATMRAGRVVTPLFLAGTVGAYLTWAIGVAASIYQ